MHSRIPAQILNTSIDRNDDEQKLGEIAKHPFGIILFYIQAACGIILSVGLSYFLLPSLIEDTSTAFLVANIFALIAILLAVIIVTLTSIIYNQNRLIITDRNITQVLQYGLFNRKVSQLNMLNVEDVTATQKGILSTVLGYGELTIETAGEQMNFHFTYCPRPSYYAKVILKTREKMLGQQYSGPAAAQLPPAEVVR